MACVTEPEISFLVWQCWGAQEVTSMGTTLRQGRGAFDTPWPYVGIAVFSALSSLLMFGPTMFLGLMVGIVGSCRGALSKHERGRIQGVHILFAGLAFLTGPLAYFLLARWRAN